MKILWFRIGRHKIKNIVNDINELLSAQIETEQNYLNELRNLVIFLGSQRQKETEMILSSGKGYFTGESLQGNLQLKFNAITNYPFFKDFLDNKKPKTFENTGILAEEMNNFKDDQELQLTQDEIQVIKSYAEYELSKIARL